MFTLWTIYNHLTMDMAYWKHILGTNSNAVLIVKGQIGEVLKMHLVDNSGTKIFAFTPF